MTKSSRSLFTTRRVLRNAFCLLPLVAVMLISSSKLHPTNSAALPQQGPLIQSHQSAGQSDDPHRIFAPHWSTEGSFITTIYIRNVHINRTITARLSLILERRTITLPWTS